MHVFRIIPSLMWANGFIQFATRLMIVRGDFETVSMAIYGEPISDAPVPSTSYEPQPLPVLDHVSISPALDLAKSTDPTNLARQLLSLISHAPSLNLVIRLMFCLKPPNDDWDLPEFPHLYSDLNEEDIDIDLDSAFRCLSRPVADDISADPLQRFGEKIAEAISPMVGSFPLVTRLPDVNFRSGQHSFLFYRRNSVPVCFTTSGFRARADGK